jgi:Nif-specific regulatory protein
VDCFGPRDRVYLERDLYARCLDLSRAEDPAPLLTQTLEVLREAIRAERGYIELRDVHACGERSWSADAGVDADEREAIRDRISRGVIAEAIETGTTIHTPSAQLDARFSERQSVRAAKIEAVLCIPLRADEVIGVVYLHNRIGGGPFADDDVRCAQRVARFVGTVAGRLLELLRRRAAEDATMDVRARLVAEGVIGRSSALARVLERLAVVASMETNVLFTGASGTGKSMLARVLHENSPRRGGPLVELNCAALPESLVESELFGAERGAHSAVTGRGMVGKVAAAEGGTLFLDEIGDLSTEVQAKLLQLLQSKQYFPLGGTRVRHADVRIVAATNRDLEQAIDDGAFREDLYYRLRGVVLEVPALEERREDIPLLARHLCEQSCLRNGLAPMLLSASAMSAIEFADWPGNVRQLASVCEEAVVNARMEGASTIDVRHVFPRRNASSSELPETFQGARQRMERTFLASALAARDWNVALTARELAMSRSHLNALIRRYALHRQPA